MQFYVIVPFLFYSFEWLDKREKYWKFMLMASIGLGSFALQTYLDGDFSHMLLPCRLWQFMCGFLAFYLHETGVICTDRCIKLKDSDNKTTRKEGSNLEYNILNLIKCLVLINWLKWAFLESIKTKFIYALIGMLCLDVPYNFLGQLQRLGVVLLSMLIMAQKTPTWLLTLKPLVALGDCSYSVYLVHWPLFTLHRYWYPEIYTNMHNYPTFIGNIYYDFLYL
jgi:peptidoglycan/LPS O-acetylase OafA/YrhL